MFLNYNIQPQPFESQCPLPASNTTLVESCPTQLILKDETSHVYHVVFVFA